MLIPLSPPPLHPAGAVAVVRLSLSAIGLFSLACILTHLKGWHRHPVTQRHPSSGKPGLQFLLDFSVESTRLV